MDLSWDSVVSSLLGALFASIFLVVGYVLVEWLRYKFGRNSTLFGAMQAAANAALVEGQRVAAERRIRAVEELWCEVVRLRIASIGAISGLDLLGPAEYWRAVENEHIDEPEVMETLHQVMAHSDIEHIRPIVGEHLYALLSTYKVVMGRFCCLLYLGKRKQHVGHWTEDELFCRLIEQTLTSEEMQQFKDLESDHAEWTTLLMEKNILAELRRVVAGEYSGDEGIEQSQRVIAAVQQIERDDRRMHLKP